MTAWPSNWPPFLFGAATSSHQIEGSETNDWTQWEASGKTRDVSGRAADHWTRWREDFDILAALQLNSYRMSIEWSRVEPSPGQFDASALAQYRAMLIRLRELNIIPLVTLHHFTLPQWVSGQGGFLHPRAREWFVRYVDTTLKAFGDLADLWITINEPMVLVVMGYLMALWPPGSHGFRRALRLIDRLADLHRAAYTAIKNRKPAAMAGLAHHIIAFEPWKNTQSDRLTARLLHYLMNQRFINLVGGSQDFYGINYYTRQYGHWSRGLHPIQSRAGKTLSDLGWELYPEGLNQVLTQIRLDNKPILITENGIASTNDSLRIQYLKDHLSVVGRMQQDGLDIRGYFHWSLLDNFEWAEGFGPRFGLVEVDYDTMQRRMRDSAYIYRDIVQANPGTFPISVPPGLTSSPSRP